MDKFWITPQYGGKVFDVAISGWVLSSRKQLMSALTKIQTDYDVTIISIHRFMSMWNIHYVVFTEKNKNG